jgi:histidinol-phosphate/aromatic aminotransferase/cobyric acid decarboxylase-like protein
LTPYTPGEQPQDQQYVKLNTNESPFPPSPKALAYAAAHTRALHLYSDPDCLALREALAAHCDVTPDEVIVTNGSDEVLNFAFQAFCDADHPAVFPDVTYGFYPVFAAVNGLPYREIPLSADFSVNVADTAPPPARSSSPTPTPRGHRPAGRGDRAHPARRPGPRRRRRRGLRGFRRGELRAAGAQV